MMINGNYDWDAFCNITMLQQSRNRDDHERLVHLLKNFGSSDGWKICAAFLLRDHSFNEIYKQSNDLSMKDFFCFRGIEEYLNHRYQQEINEELSENMHIFILKWIESYVFEKNGAKKENFIRNKCIQIVTKVAIVDYPKRWPTFFKDLLHVLHSSNTNLFVKETCPKSLTVDGCLSFDFFLKFLIYWDCEVCSRDVQTDDLLERNTSIKDWMRDKDIVNIMSTITFVITEINMNHPGLFKKALKVASLYISWIDIRLVVNDSIIASIIKPLNSSCNADDNIKSAAINCFINILLKGMPASHKLELIYYIYQKLTLSGVWQWIEKAKMIPDESGPQFDCDEDDNDNCFFVTLGTLVNTMGVQLVETVKSLKESKSDQVHTCMTAIYEKMTLALDVVSCANDSIGSTCFPFVQSFVSLLKTIYKPEVKKSRKSTKSVAQLNDNERAIVDHCLKVLTHRMQYPSWYNFEKEDEAEGNFQQNRKHLATVLTNLIQLNEHIVLKYIVELLKYTASHCASVPYEQVETVLKMIYSIADAVKSVKGDYFSADCEISAYTKEIMGVIVASDIGRHRHPEVRLAFFELMLRYEKYFNYDREFLLDVVRLFLSDSGLQSPELRVVSRCVYILSRLIKIHKSKFGTETVTILREISSILHFSFVNNHNSVLFCDNSATVTAYSYLYESAATLLVSSPDIGDRCQTFQALLQPIIDQVPSLCREWSQAFSDASQPRVAKATQMALGLHSAITHINYTCKAFGGSQSMSRSNCLEVYMAALDVLIGNLQCAVAIVSDPMAIGRDRINSGMRSLLHQLCKCAQNDAVSIAAVLNRLPHAIWLFLPRDHASSIHGDHLGPLCGELEEILSLFIQIFHAFKDQSIDFLRGSLSTLLNICYSVIKSSRAVIDQQLQEEQQDDNELGDHVRQLSRAYVQLIGTDLSILVSALEANHLTEVITTAIDLVQQSIDRPDPTIVKLCVQFFSKFLSNFAQLAIKGDVKESILYQLIYRRLLPLLVYLPSREGFNLADAQFNVALNEIANCQKAMALCGGAQFLHYLQTQCLPELMFDTALVARYCQALNLSEKEYQSFLKNFYLEARSR